MSSPVDDDGTGLPHLRDAEGNRIPLYSRVEQVAVDEEHGAPFSRLHQQGEVAGRDAEMLDVRFDDGYTITLRPELVRVLNPGGAA